MMAQRPSKAPLHYRAHLGFEPGNHLTYVQVMKNILLSAVYTDTEAIHFADYIMRVSTIVIHHFSRTDFAFRASSTNLLKNSVSLSSFAGYSPARNGST
jgi:hypothetical protein